MKKKMKRFDGGGYTGDDEIVKYRMGMTDTAKEEPKAEPAPSLSEDESGRGNVSPAAAEFNKDTGNEPSAPAKKAAAAAIKKTVAPVVKKADEEASATPKAAPTRQQKNAPKMIQDQPYKSKSGMTGNEAKTVLFGSSSNDSPRMRAAKRARDLNPDNRSMKAGGKVSSASSRADGIATKGKTRGKMC